MSLAGFFLAHVRNIWRENNNLVKGGGVNEKIILKIYPKTSECESGPYLTNWSSTQSSDFVNSVITFQAQ
jgi:hypothetical protein